MFIFLTIITVAERHSSRRIYWIYLQGHLHSAQINVIARKLVHQVHFNGVEIHTHESYSGETFNTLGVAANGVSTVMLESVGLLSDEWISLIEVSGCPSTYVSPLP